jgi:DNA repair protein RecO
MLLHREHRELQTLRDFEVVKARRGLAGHPVRLAGASVLAEVVLQHAEGEATPGLFRALDGGLDEVESETDGMLLSRIVTELWTLVQALGYAPVLDRCVQCGRAPEPQDLLRFDHPSGGLRCSDCPAELPGPRLGPRARQQLRELLGRSLSGPLMRPRAHLRLAGDFIAYHVSGGTPLRSLAVLDSLLPRTHA